MKKKYGIMINIINYDILFISTNGKIDFQRSTEFLRQHAEQTFPGETEDLFFITKETYAAYIKASRTWKD